MFIEPSIRIDVRQDDGSQQRQGRVPDLVICDTREVIGIIEVKYQPRGLPKWKKDLSTFKWIVANRDQISISNARFRGIAADERIYRLAKDILFAWMGVHCPWPSRLVEHIDPQLREFFVEHHAETTHGSDPRIS